MRAAASQSDRATTDVRPRSRVASLYLLFIFASRSLCIQLQSEHEWPRRRQRRREGERDEQRESRGERGREGSSRRGVRGRLLNETPANEYSVREGWDDPERGREAARSAVSSPVFRGETRLQAEPYDLQLWHLPPLSLHCLSQSLTPPARAQRARSSSRRRSPGTIRDRRAPQAPPRAARRACRASFPTKSLPCHRPVLRSRG